MRSFICRGLVFAWVLCLLVGRVGLAQQPTPKVKEPEDKKAYLAANSLADPDQRIAALQQFVVQYPKSQRVSRAQYAILNVLLEHYPQRTDAIDQQAQRIVKATHRGDSRRSTEVNLAFGLADAGTDGADLKRAATYAKDGLQHSSEAEFDATLARQMAKFHYTMTPDQMHHYYAQSHSEALAAQAYVDLHLGKLDQATALLQQAFQLDPDKDDVNTAMARLALQQGRKADALADFERASLVGTLDPRWRKQMVELYRTEHSGSDTGMVSQMDAMYARIFPPTFTPAKAAAVPAGHTVLLQLFTGSGCPPCVGGDLAVEGLLASHPRTELVALAFDQHIPEPDPLANPDSVAESDVYNIRATPTYVLDGATVALYGGDRSGSEKLYQKLAHLVDEEAATPSHVTLHLAATPAADGTLSVQAEVTTGTEAELREQIARKIDVKPPLDEAEKKAAEEAKKNAKPPRHEKKKTKPASPSAKPATTAAAATAKPAAPPAPQLQLHVALVEDDVRYSGENGIRFHRMVVRALDSPAADGMKVALGRDTTLHTSFDPQQISQRWAAYLTKYEGDNDRFGRFEFISKDTTINPHHIAVAAWVQDATSHRILQAAFVPLEGSQPQP